MDSMKKIWDLELLHEYYKDGKSKDFSIEPTSSTLYSLAGLNLSVKSNENGLSIIGSRPEFPLETPLQFTLQLRDPDFFHFTDIPQTAGSIHWYEFHSSRVDHKQVRLLSSIFTFTYQSTSSPLYLRLEDTSGNLHGEVISRTQGGTHEFGMDLSGRPHGLYSLRIVKGKKVLHQETVCINDELIETNAFAVLVLLPQRLKLEKSHQIKFKSKNESWKFYFISSKESDDVFILKDESKSNGTNRYAGTTFKFSERPVTEEIDGSQVTYFETGTLNDDDEFIPQLIPTYEESKKNLVLYRYGFINHHEEERVKSRYSKYRRRRDDDNDDDDDHDYFIYTCIERSFWDKRLKHHLISKGRKIYRKYKLRKRGMKVLSNVPNPSQKQLKKEVYIYI